MTSYDFVIRIWLIHFFLTYGINRTTLLLTKHYLLILISGLHCLHVKLRYNLRKMDINASVTLVIRAPNQRIEDHTVECMLGWTVKKLKKHLEDVYPSNPVSTQKYPRDHGLQTYSDVLWNTVYTSMVLLMSSYRGYLDINPFMIMVTAVLLYCRVKWQSLMKDDVMSIVLCTSIKYLPTETLRKYMYISVIYNKAGDGGGNDLS